MNIRILDFLQSSHDILHTICNVNYFLHEQIIFYIIEKSVPRYHLLSPTSSSAFSLPLSFPPDHRHRLLIFLLFLCSLLPSPSSFSFPC